MTAVDLARHDRAVAAETSFARVSYLVLVDTYQRASATYWRRRAAQLEAARPRRGDYTGSATAEDLVEQYARLTDAAQACRARADWLDGHRHDLDGTLTDIGGPIA